MSEKIKRPTGNRCNQLTFRKSFVALLKFGSCIGHVVGVDV